MSRNSKFQVIIYLLILVTPNYSCVQKKSSETKTNGLEISKTNPSYAAIDTNNKLKYTTGICSILHDSKGNYWFGSYQEGVCLFDGKTFTFFAKDYRHGGKNHPVTLTDREFARRFAMHILPKGFIRIRHYGILSSSLKKNIIPVLQKQLKKPALPDKPPLVQRPCPVCRTGELVTLITFTARGSPIGVVLQELLQHFPGIPKLTP